MQEQFQVSSSCFGARSDTTTFATENRVDIAFISCQRPLRLIKPRILECFYTFSRLRSVFPQALKLCLFKAEINFRFRWLRGRALVKRRAPISVFATTASFALGQRLWKQGLCDLGLFDLPLYDWGLCDWGLGKRAQGWRPFAGMTLVRLGVRGAWTRRRRSGLNYCVPGRLCCQ